MLHLVFQSPLQNATLQRIGHEDAVLFLENAVLCLLKNGAFQLQLLEMLKNKQLFVLLADIETRGILPDELIAGIQVIDYAQWVDLTTRQQPVQSWF